MGAFYDTYDYSSYWEGREYENDSEMIAIKEMLSKIPKVEKGIEIGAGYGRLVPYYIYRIKRLVLAEPSAKLLSQAKTTLGENGNIKFVQSTVENLNNKFRSNSFDLIVMVRVMHHLTHLDATFETLEKLTKPQGYLILEFANKIHFKNVVQAILRRDFGFIKNREIIDVRSDKAKKAKMITFVNHHPSSIKEELIKHNFEIIEMKSVSNIRSPFLKKHLQKDFLLEIERHLQNILAPIYFGPSIFILARKKG